MRKRKYAETTAVPVDKSKGEITKLLRNWGCDRVGWQEDFHAGRVELVFVWTRNTPDADETMSYGARITVSLPTAREIHEDPANIDKRTNTPSPARVKQALERQGRSEFRLLLLWLKAAFNAVDAGIITPEMLFMPFFVTNKGDTIAEVVLKDFPSLIAGKDVLKRLSAG